MKSVLITGASTGIGAACAHYLAEQGWQVFAGVRTDVDAQRLAGERITPVLIDITKPDQIEAAAALIDQQVGAAGLQGLVNNAGIGIAGPLEFLPISELRRQFEVNFFGHAAVTQAFLPLLRRGQGRIANMSSIGGRIAAPFLGPYTASKFALEAYSDALRRELRPWGLHVAVIEPGAFSTRIWGRARQTSRGNWEAMPPEAHELYGRGMHGLGRSTERSDERGLDPVIVARSVHHALSARRPKTRYVMGRGTWVTALASRLLPDRWLDRIIARRMYR